MFVGIMDILMIVGITNMRKDNVPLKRLIILSKTKSFKDMWLGIIT